MKTNVSAKGTSVLDLFQGLNDQQARELRARMLPALLELREQIVGREQAEPAARAPAPVQVFPRKRQAARLELEESAGERS